MAVQRVKQKEAFTVRVRNFVGSPWFFHATIAFFVLEALWLTISSNFPQAYDTSYHVGIIQVYSHQWSPFITHQDPSTYVYGDIVHYPSYLYHYIMSFPYRFVNLFTNNLNTIVQWITLVNIAFWVGGMYVYRKVLGYTKATKPIINFCLFIFSVLPLLPYIAAQINYDGLLFLGSGLSIWLTLIFLKKIGQGNYDFKTLALLISTVALTSLVQFSFLPIMLSIIIFVVWNTVVHIREKRGEFVEEAKTSWKTTSLLAKVGVIALLVVSLFLFGQRYGMDIIKYHSPNPDCAKTLSVAACSNYAVWNQYHLAQQNTPHETLNQITHWILEWPIALQKEFFTIISTTTSAMSVPVKVFVYACDLFVLLGCMFILYYWRKVFIENFAMRFFIVTTFLLVVSLFMSNFSLFMRTGIFGAAIQGRYLLNVLPLFIVLVAMSYSLFLHRKRHKHLKVWFAIAVLLFFTQGGGDLTFLLRTDASWYVENKAIVSINESLQGVARHIILNKK